MVNLCLNDVRARVCVCICVAFDIAVFINIDETHYLHRSSSPLPLPLFPVLVIFSFYCMLHNSHNLQHSVRYFENWIQTKKMKMANKVKQSEA